MHSAGAPESMKRSITAFHQFFGTRKELTKNVLISGTKGDEWSQTTLIALCNESTQLSISSTFTWKSKQKPQICYFCRKQKGSMDLASLKAAAPWSHRSQRLMGARAHTGEHAVNRCFQGPATHTLARTENMIASSWLIICVIFKLEITQLEMRRGFFLCAAGAFHLHAYTLWHTRINIFSIPAASRATRGVSVWNLGNDKQPT